MSYTFLHLKNILKYATKFWLLAVEDESITIFFELGGGAKLASG